MYIYIYICLVVWNMNFIFHSVGKNIIPTDEVHHVSEGFSTINQIIVIHQLSINYPLNLLKVPYTIIYYRQIYYRWGLITYPLSSCAHPSRSNWGWASDQGEGKIAGETRPADGTWAYLGPRWNNTTWSVQHRGVNQQEWGHVVGSWYYIKIWYYIYNYI